MTNQRFEVIPAIDLRGGRCVRLRQGDYARETVYGDDPVAMARRWEAEGARWLHLVDLDGARAGQPAQLETVRRVAAAVRIPIQLGGGLRDTDAVRAALDAGAERAIVGTTAAEDPERAGRLFQEFGDRLILGLDAREGRVAVRGWEAASDWDAVILAQAMTAAGARRIIYTDICRDGMLVGPAVESTRRLAEAVPVPVIASGGVSALEDIRRLAELAPLGVEGVIVGRALYTGQVHLAEALKEIATHFDV
ncbi:MAG: 1-(5-phosphoribosyl)-5-[(5-phosphoribosylamino)methylideneamino]imidazole-4-carboxamide isomerase [Armatimonadetes bacterium]|nr:1-(5-phosphoribosyl)-5-[(5-phosphoribosylamino)methylideneamino]imidazole-4-carboxamide isomerase [Armatimonadota bacterium]